MSMDIISKLKNSNLAGRGGACFPTGLKWELVKKAKGKKKYIVCNGSEGEPNLFKDGYILKNHPEEVIKGIEIALKTIHADTAYIYLRKDYYKKFKKKLQKLAKNLPIKFAEKPHYYLAGEETVALNAIEGKRVEPREKPPFPTNKGLFGCPTLINNVETFYCIAQIAGDKYKHIRFYSISGDILRKGVYELPENWTIEKILKETKNWPHFDFFIQVGGGAIGEILLTNELKQPVRGGGAIIIYNKKKHTPLSLIKKWAQFFLKGNCDKCVPCREGVFRIAEMADQGVIDKKLLEELLFVLEETSFCPLGKNLSLPFRSLLKKIDKIWNQKKYKSL